MSYYQCGKHRPKFLGIPLGFPEGKNRRRLCKGLLFFIAVVLFVILVIYLTLRPQKPRFSVQEAVIRQWNVTEDDMLTSNLQFTIVSHNPNDRIGIYYDGISAYATYLSLQITPNSALTPFYQGHNHVDLISPVLNGIGVPLARIVADHLQEERHNGILTVNLRIGGRIRWKVGTWTSGHYHLNVNCFAVLGLSSCCSGNPVPLQQGTRCDAEV